MSGPSDTPVPSGDDGFAEIVVAAELAEQKGGGAAASSASVETAHRAAAAYRYGLIAVAAFLLLFNIIFAVLQTGTHPSQADASSLSLVVRAAANAMVLGILWLLPSLRRRGLLLVELLLFGTEMLVLLDSQYFTGVHLIEQRDLIDAVAVQKNGVLRGLVLIFCSAVFLPHPPKVAGRVAVTMAGAIVLCHAFVLDHARTAHLVMDDMASHRVVMFNAVALTAGVVLASLAGWSLRGRRDVIAPGGQLGPYRLQLRLDAGPMGEVYLAEHETLSRPCAVKIVSASQRRRGIENERFAREVRAASALRHPSAVTIYDCGQATNGASYYAMEFLPGLTVAGLVGRFGTMPAGRVIYLARQICGVLNEAHRRGLIHRDLAASNVFVSVLGGQCDVAKLLDFGVVALTGETAGQAGSHRVAGTPEFLAPEQAVAAGSVDARADVYGLGALLVFMLTGRPPYQGDTPDEVLRMHVSEPLSSVERLISDVPGDLRSVVLQCLAKEPSERFASSEAVSAALRACDAASEWSDEAAAAWWRQQVDL